MDLQFQIRQNALEVQSFVQDLYDWEKKVAKRDLDLKKGIDRSGSRPTGTTTAAPSSSTIASGQAAPPVRGRASTVISEAPKALQTPNPALNPTPGTAGAGERPKRRIRRKKAKRTAAQRAADAEAAAKLAGTAAYHTYDAYRSRWDKFDVEKALEEAEDTTEWETVTEESEPESAPPPSSTPHLTEVSSTRANPPAPSSTDAKPKGSAFSFDSGRPAVRQPPARAKEPETAEEWKDQGNEEYKGYQYEAAIECYSKSLGLQETSVAFANRAMARLKMAAKVPSKASDHCTAAEEDCTRALQLDPQYVKALQRRATARLQLGKARLALSDFEAALRLEPSNQPLRDERDAAFTAAIQAERLRDIAPPPPVRLTVRRTVTAKKEAPAPPPTPSTAPLGSVEETKETQPRGTAPASAAPAPGPRSPADLLTGLARPAAGEGEAAAAAVAAVPAVPKPTGRRGIQVVEETAAAPSPSAAAVPPPSSSDSTAVSQEAGRPAGDPAPTAAAVMERAAAAVELVSAQRSAGASTAVRPPKTSTEFETAWKSFKGDLEAQSRYLRAISPPSLPLIFKSSMTAPLLSSLLSTALTAFASTPEDLALLVDLLESLTRVPRFAMTAMGIPSKDKIGLLSAYSAAVNAAKEAGVDGLVEKLEGELRKQFRL